MAGELQSRHNNNSRRKREHKAVYPAVLLTVIVSMTFGAL